jgi:hypothetical protein
MFTITVTDRHVAKAARMLGGQPVEVVPNAKVAVREPLWARRTVEIVGVSVEEDVLRAWILDEDGMPEQRVFIDPDDVATILLKGES